MKKTLRRLLYLCTALVLCVAMLAGCAPAPSTTSIPDSSTVTPDTTPATGGEGDAQTVTVTDVRGEVEIPADPQRIVDLSGNSDILHILGYKVAGTANSDAYDYTKFPSFLEDALAGAKIVGFSYQDTMDVENILSLEPDLIIISTRQEKMYDQLKEAAPTVMIELAQIDWKEDILTLAKMFGKTADAEAWLKDYSDRAAAAGEQIRSKLGADKSYVSMLASGGQLYIFDAAGMGSVLYEDMGLNKPVGMPEQENVSLPVVTYEGLAAIEADYILVLGTDEDMAALKDNAIWKSLPAVTAGHVAELPASPYFNQGYSSIGRSLLLDELGPLLESIAK